MKLADEEYPVEADRMEDVVEDICGGKPRALALLTPRAVLPVSIYEWFEGYVGKGNLRDAQEIYYKIKYEKSDIEMELTRQAAKISDVMTEAMLAVMKPYTGTHNSGYTECQEFYGAITLNSEEPLGNQIVMMLDVAARPICVPIVFWWQRKPSSRKLMMPSRPMPLRARLLRVWLHPVRNGSLQRVLM